MAMSGTISRCSVCFTTAGHVRLPHPITPGSKIAPDVAHFLRLVSKSLGLCARCEREITKGGEGKLRSNIPFELVARKYDKTEIPARLVGSEFAIMLASWKLSPFKHPALTAGFCLFNDICARYPATVPSHPTLSGLLERDLRDGVLGIFSVSNGILIIDNLVSRIRGEGHAKRALHDICSMADATNAIVVDVAERNPYAGVLAIGAPVEALLRWYRREGFEVESEIAVRRLPQNLFETR